jgi:hypothetical protein
MTRLFSSRIGLPLIAMMPIGLLGCDADSDRWISNGIFSSPAGYYYDSPSVGSVTSSDGGSGSGWGGQPVADRNWKKHRR